MWVPREIQKMSFWHIVSNGPRISAPPCTPSPPLYTPPPPLPLLLAPPPFNAHTLIMTLRAKFEDHKIKCGPFWSISINHKQKCFTNFVYIGNGVHWKENPSERESKSKKNQNPSKKNPYRSETIKWVYIGKRIHPKKNPSEIESK